MPRERLRSISVIALCVAILALNNGLIFSGLTIFDVAILHDLQISVAALKLRDTLTLGTFGILAPLAGLLFDRLPARPMLGFGLVCMAVGFACYAHVTSVEQIYAVHVLLGISQASCGTVGCIFVAAQWPGKHKGAVIALVIAGSSLGNALIPPLNVALLQRHDWRQVLTMSAWAPLALIPFVVALMGSLRSGRASRANLAKQMEAPKPASPSRGDPLRTPDFWLLAGSACTSCFCVSGLAASLALFVQISLHQPLQQAGQLLFGLFAAAVVGQILAGVVADRLTIRLVHFTVLAIMTAAMAALLAAPAEQAVLIVLAFGLGWGGNSALLQVRPVRLFAGQGLGRALGGLALFETLGGGLAPFICGRLYDVSGRFFASFTLLTVVAAIALLLAALIRRDAGATQPLATGSAY